MDGLFEILIILAFFLLPVLEGILKKRRREQGGEGPGPEAPPPSSREAGEEEPASSVEMIPEEYWEELMRGEADLDEAPARTSTAEPPAPPEEWEPAPRDAEGWESEPWEGADADRGERAPGTWISEPPEEVRAEREPAAPEGAERPRAPTSDAEAEREALRRELAAGSAGAGGARSRAARLRSVRSGRMARRGRTPSAGAHPLLGDLDVESMRRAVVWREVLGPPAALRDERP